MKRIIGALLVATLLLTGCASAFDGSYVATYPHQEQGGLLEDGAIQAASYDELLNAVIGIAERGFINGIVFIPMYDSENVAADMEKVAKELLTKSAIAAYAVQEIKWDIGNNNGQRAIAVNISYIHDRAEIQKIRKVKDLEEATQVIHTELDNISAGVVLYLENYVQADFVQLVDKYAFNNPQSVMEVPQVVANIYSQSGPSCVVELKFTYQNTRESLRQMKAQVSSVYTVSQYQITQDATEKDKFTQLYSFLMDRGFGEYTIETSNTPAYSLLWHGAGDSRAFATLYAAFCRGAELDCRVITGNREGEPWYWNLVKIDKNYYHLDLHRCHEEGAFRLMLDEEMIGYVWNYSAHPATPEKMDPQIQETQPEGTEPGETKSE